MKLWECSNRQESGVRSHRVRSHRVRSQESGVRKKKEVGKRNIPWQLTTNN
ncbi:MULTISPECIES: hypothetical protein [unclassified Dolichospermum]|uniref:hypothetical protein n=1 Tax=unclassified Dolichospermum TaxID=2622029 RepID=UPI001447C38B|nr:MULTISPECIES: hypothetical protein [unclassified Dolichospermum]